MTNIKQTWTYKHKLLLVTIALAVAHIVPLVPMPQLLQAETMTYTATSTAYTLEREIEKRTIELYEKNRALDLERYRHEAIQSVNMQLSEILYVSPYVDYDALKAKYGY